MALYLEVHHDKTLIESEWLSDASFLISLPKEAQGHPFGP